jgi:branched-chain amino acid transport system permease protein
MAGTSAAHRTRATSNGSSPGGTESNDQRNAAAIGTYSVRDATAGKRLGEDEPIVIVTDLHKTFGGIKAIDGISLQVKRGRVVGLVGQNGCGKSTLLNLVSGFYKPDSGSVRISDREIAGWTPHRIAQSGVGRTFQVPRLVDKASVIDNIAAGLIEQGRPRLFASFLGLPVIRRESQQRRERAAEMMRILGLSPHLANELADSLPLGLKRIVEVGRAAVSGPSLLLLDEPAAGLDGDERDQLRKSVQALADAGVTPVVVEHNIEFVLSLCSTVVLMESGSIACVHHQDSDDPMPEQMVRYLRYAEVE